MTQALFVLGPGSTEVAPHNKKPAEAGTVLQSRGLGEPCHHTDRNRLRRIGEATPNPLVR
jgi:hypothetical protein